MKIPVMGAGAVGRYYLVQRNERIIPKPTNYRVTRS